MPKTTKKSEAAKFKDLIKDERNIMREFVGKSGNSYLAFWFFDGSFALFQKAWEKDPFSHCFIPKTLAKPVFVNELEIEIEKDEYDKLSTYQIAKKLLKGELKSKHQ